MGSPVPFRVDLFDDEIDSIRTFDPDTQRSLYPVPEVRLLPGREFPMDDDARARLLDHLRGIRIEEQRQLRGIEVAVLLARRPRAVTRSRSVPEPARANERLAPFQQVVGKKGDVGAERVEGELVE